ncbi:hypothetical protein CDL12_27651 [Handroanthus impetiginosus]|uniref:Uncharacterized protein n=1 Tax=Handroanthus impetiginosus TaxID=429701 RepID=A0A2G9G4L3_9LAMI|nr:hypothetical protein CDL12_27651 [Handroanthus impetiginosus]
MINKLILHFKISIRQPQCMVPIIHLKRPLPHGPGPSIILLRFFPPRILHPNALIPPHSSD